MSDEKDILFEAVTPLGFHVRVTKAYWELIVNVKHPIMAGREDDVKDTLEDPDEIRQSKSDDNVYLFYTQRGHKLRFFKGGKPQFVTVGII